MVDRTLVLAGGGHAHVEILRRLAERPIEGVRLMLISPDTHTAYSGMLPGLIAGHCTWDDGHIDLRGLCDRAGVEFLVTRVEGIDPAGRQMHCANGQTCAFDALSLDVGSTPDLRSVPGAAEHTVPVKPISGLLQSWGTLVARCEARSTGRPRMAVVGGGAGGVEIALAMRHHCRLADLARQPEIALVTDGLLPTHARWVRLLLERALVEHRVTLVRQGRATHVMPGEIHCASGEPVPARVGPGQITAGFSSSGSPGRSPRGPNSRRPGEARCVHPLCPSVDRGASAHRSSHPSGSGQ